MFKYFNELQVHEQLRCVICLQICKTPIQCQKCSALHCYQCIISNNNQCGRGCRQKIKKVIIKPKTFRNLEQIRCKCDSCNEFISYKSYRNHTFMCSQKATEDLILNQKQATNNQNINQSVNKRISKFKLRRIMFPCFYLFERQCSLLKERDEHFFNKCLKEYDNFFSQCDLARMIYNQIIKCENVQYELQNI